MIAKADPVAHDENELDQEVLQEIDAPAHEAGRGAAALAAKILESKTE